MCVYVCTCVCVCARVYVCVASLTYSVFSWLYYRPPMQYSDRYRVWMVVSSFGVLCFCDYGVVQILCMKWDFAVPFQKDDVKSDI